MDFVNNVIERLKTKKNISDNSVAVYIRNLKKLNGDKVFGDFSFLEDVDKVLEKISKYKETTKRNYLISIVSVLSMFVDVEELKKLHDKYFGLMMKKSEEIDSKDTSEMSDQQKNNWINWDDVKKKYKELETEVNGFYKKKMIDDAQYNTLLTYALLSLYVLIAPRRNKDYQLMNVVDEFKTDMDKNVNYYDLAKKRFIFNNYKTAKKYGRFDLPVSPQLQRALNKYLKHRETRLPLDDRNNKALLLKADATPLQRSNDITKLLNKVFGKNIGSSMLRHIFLTDKYGDIFKQSKKDSETMAHSMEEQKKYIKDKLSVKV
jgi:integrase